MRRKYTTSRIRSRSGAIISMPSSRRRSSCRLRPITRISFPKGSPALSSHRYGPGGGGAAGRLFSQWTRGPPKAGCGRYRFCRHVPEDRGQALQRSLHNAFGSLDDMLAGRDELVRLAGLARSDPLPVRWFCAHRAAAPCRNGETPFSLAEEKPEWGPMVRNPSCSTGESVANPSFDRRPALHGGRPHLSATPICASVRLFEPSISKLSQ